MAGLGRKVFAPGEVLTATNVQNYLMDQAVQVYASEAARGSAIGSATTEGMVSWLSDVNELQVATGTASWVDVYPSVANVGEIVQVVSAFKTDTFSASLAAGAFADVTGLSLSITPKSASNKILVQFFLNGVSSYTLAGSIAARIVRNSTTIGVGDSPGSRLATTSGQLTAGGDGAAIMSINGLFLDSPNTTSSTTYKIQVNPVGSSTYTAFVNRTRDDNNDAFRQRTISGIVVFEVVA
jgi:hypothetical protein